MAISSEPPVPQFPLFLNIKDSSGRGYYLNLNHITFIDYDQLEIRVNNGPSSFHFSLSREDLDTVIRSLNIVNR